MHPIVEKILAFFSDLIRNSFLTGKHRMLASFDPGTAQYEQAGLSEVADRLRSAYQGSRFNSNEFLNEASFDITMAVEKRVGRDLPMPLKEAIFSAAFDLIHSEFFFLEISEAKDGWERKFDLKQEHDLKIWLKRGFR